MCRQAEPHMLHWGLLTYLASAGRLAVFERKEVTGAINGRTLASWSLCHNARGRTISSAAEMVSILNYQNGPLLEQPNKSFTTSRAFLQLVEF